MTFHPLTTVPERATEPSEQAVSGLHQAFHLRACATPDAPALTSDEEHLTYGQLEERSNRLAWHLKAMGVGPEVPVALYLDRSPAMVIAILGVLKAGGCYVPIDLAYPQERLAFMLEDTRAGVLLTQSNLSDSLPPVGMRVICLDAEERAISARPSAFPSNRTNGDNAAYIIYTSGSTGRPKGVVVTHHNVLRLIRQTDPWYGFNSQDVWPLFHSYAFDVSVWEIWGAFLHGGRLVIVPYIVSRSPTDFYRLLVREKVTVLNQTPSAFRQLIWAETSGLCGSQHSSPSSVQGGVGVSPQSFRGDGGPSGGTKCGTDPDTELNLRCVICAGEALELQSLRPWFERHGDERPLVVNMYGITETTVHSTYRPIRKADLARGAGSPIGVPIPDLRIFLLDENLQPVPRGEPGEICVGGPGVARGYLNRPELTKQRFIPDPFAQRSGARLYRSGDLARYSRDGELEYLGRMDHQVKVRGFRVELGEIESALNGHPTIRESVVMAMDGGEGVRRLVAYLVPRAAPPPVSTLRDYLGRKLPEYMTPALFVFLPSLPLTANGKVDRRALPAPGSARPNLSQDFTAPRSETERLLAGIWSEVLGIERVGVFDNFFELGGDSIRSIAILSRARQKGLRLSVEQMFRFPTVADMAACAEAAKARAPGRSQDADALTAGPFSLVSAEDRRRLPADVEDAYPVSRLQLGMFFHNELNPGSAIYHDVFSFRVRAALNRSQLEGALWRLIQRHALLRTAFDLVSFSEPMQLVHRQAPLHFGFEDLRMFAPEAQEAALLAWITREKRTPFDRSRAPLFRFHIQWLSDEAFQLIVSFHHSCLDGWSLAAITTEILLDYASGAGSVLTFSAGMEGEMAERSIGLTPRPCTRGAKESIAPPRATYREFIRLERQCIESRDSGDFWTHKLQDFAPCRLPRWNRTEPGGPFLEQVRGPEVQVGEEILTGLRRLAGKTGVPLKTVLLAAHQRVMGLLYGQSDVTTGLLCNGRPEQIDGEKLVGLFLNAVPLRQQLDGGTWLELVRQTFAAEQEIVPHRRFPLAEIRKRNGGQQLFETAFDFIHFHVFKKLEDCVGLGFEEGPYFEANDLTTYTTFSVDAHATRLELHIDYDANALCREQIEQISGYYLNTLEEMASDPEARYEAFSPLSASESRRLLVEWNQTAEDYARDRCLHELFEARARRTPEAVAVVSGDEALTYGELNRRADGVAQRLRELRAGPGVLVGTCLERSPAMVAALLGILKAGAAYVPLDPAYPKERLTFMLENASVQLLLTQRTLAGRIPGAGAQVVCVEECDQRVAEHWVRLPQLRAPQASDLAYVIYTSGSTGRPKAVQVTHQAVVNVLTSLSNRLGLTPKDNLLAVTTLSFDIAALELFGPLTTGGRVTLAATETAADGFALAALIGSSGATVMQATPSTWRLLIESGWAGQPGRFAKILCGGEALPRDLADQLLARAGRVWNVYGPTETTIWSTIWQAAPITPISIGRPLANTQLFILDKWLQPAPVGVPGELCIGGDGLARGYLNQPELTSQRFIPNPFDPKTGIRLYRTGDLARYRPDGFVEWVGRLDCQVKIRGHRIELGEIETALREHAALADALVAAPMDAHREQRLVAYVVPRNGALSLPELREFLRAKLPAYMIPSQFVSLNALPRTANGKADRRALPSPETQAVPPPNFVAPRNEVERTLADIWREVLGLRHAGVKDDFFELGGDSLSATRVFARINRQFGARVTLKDLFEHPTICALAGLIARAPTAPARPPIARQARRVIRLATRP